MDHGGTDVMSHHKIEVKNVHFAYGDDFVAIQDISFKIHDGEAVGIIGANGAGKSTLLMLLMGLLFPKSGEVRIGDVHVTQKTLPLLRQRLGFVFQEPDDMLFMTTVYEDVAFGPRNYKLDPEDVDIRVNEALEAVGISHLRDKAPYKLSGGEKKAAAIATVLAMAPDILIMDEPTAALDPKSRRKMIQLLNGFDHTKIITSHDLDMILDTCQRVIVLKNGTVIAEGSAYALLSNAALMDDCGLEIPLSLQNCVACKS